MALTVDYSNPPPRGVPADRRLFLNQAQDRVVEESDPEAAYLFVPPETLIPPEDMEKYGLTVVDGVIVLPGAEPVEPEAEEEPEVEPEPEPKPARSPVRKAKAKKRKR